MSLSELTPDEQRKVDEVKSACQGMDAQLVTYGEEGVTPDTSLRWLKARKWDVKVATKDLKEHAAWRERFMTPYPGHRHIPTSIVATDIERKLVYILGFSKKHHPTITVVCGNHIPQDVDKTKRMISYTLDAAIYWGHLNMAQKKQEAEQQGVTLERDFYDGKTVGIFDLSNWGYANSDLSALKAVFELLQNHYVERLYRLYLYAAPMIFSGIWKLVYPLIDAKTKEKVVFIDKSNKDKHLSPLFDKEALSPVFGGTFEPIPMDKVWELIEERLPELKPQS